MMKTAILLSSLIMLGACGKIDSPNDRFGRRSYQALSVNSNDIATLTGICVQLTQKAGLIESSLGTNFNFTLTEKSCGSDDGNTSNVSVTSQKEGQEYVFKQNLQYFKFQYVETNNSGVMKDICNNLSDLTNPYKTSNGTAVWFSLNPRTSDCKLETGTRCILLETGTPTVNGDIFDIDTRDWIRLVTDPQKPQVGFFNYRKRQSRAFCEGEKFSETTAELR